MTTLRPDEIHIIACMFKEPPNCPARSHSLKLLAGPDPEALQEISLYLAQTSQPCREIWALGRLYQDHRIRAAERDRCRRDPTTQERDRKNSTFNKGE